VIGTVIEVRNGSASLTRWLVRFVRGEIPRTFGVEAPTAEEARAIASPWFPDMEWVSTEIDTKTSRHVANSERTGPHWSRGMRR